MNSEITAMVTNEQSDIERCLEQQGKHIWINNFLFQSADTDWGIYFQACDKKSCNMILKSHNRVNADSLVKNHTLLKKIDPNGKYHLRMLDHFKCKASDDENFMDTFTVLEHPGGKLFALDEILARKVKEHGVDFTPDQYMDVLNDYHILSVALINQCTAKDLREDRKKSGGYSLPVYVPEVPLSNVIIYSTARRRFVIVDWEYFSRDEDFKMAKNQGGMYGFIPLLKKTHVVSENQRGYAEKKTEEIFRDLERRQEHKRQELLKHKSGGGGSGGQKKQQRGRYSLEDEDEEQQHAPSKGGHQEFTKKDFLDLLTKYRLLVFSYLKTVDPDDDENKVVVFNNEGGTIVKRVGLRLPCFLCSDRNFGIRGLVHDKSSGKWDFNEKTLENIVSYQPFNVTNDMKITYEIEGQKYVNGDYVNFKGYLMAVKGGDPHGDMQNQLNHVFDSIEKTAVNKQREVFKKTSYNLMIYAPFSSCSPHQYVMCNINSKAIGEMMVKNMGNKSTHLITDSYLNLSKKFPFCIGIFVYQAGTIAGEHARKFDNADIALLNLYDEELPVEDSRGYAHELKKLFTDHKFITAYGEYEDSNRNPLFDKRLIGSLQSLKKAGTRALWVGFNGTTLAKFETNSIMKKLDDAIKKWMQIYQY